MTPGLPASAEIEQALSRLATLADDEMDLAEAALMLAALERPRVALDRYRLHLQDLAESVADATTRRRGDVPELDARTGALIAAIAKDAGYRGDALTYDDLQNANLIRVIDRRKGLPVALGILYIHAARAQGWRAYGMNFPGHFLIAVEDGDSRAVVDPFHGEQLAGASALRNLLKSVMGEETELNPAYCAPLGNRAVLLRLQNNIKMRLAAQGRLDKATDIVERMLLFAPDEVRLWREAGTMHAQLGNLRAALSAYERFLDLSQDSAARFEVAQTMQVLRRRLH